MLSRHLLLTWITVARVLTVSVCRWQSCYDYCYPQATSPSSLEGFMYRAGLFTSGGLYVMPLTCEGMPFLRDMNASYKYWVAGACVHGWLSSPCLAGGPGGFPLCCSGGAGCGGWLLVCLFFVFLAVLGPPLRSFGLFHSPLSL